MFGIILDVGLRVVVILKGVIVFIFFMWGKGWMEVIGVVFGVRVLILVWVLIFFMIFVRFIILLY